ncbi:MAG: hypothetical protein ACKVOI_12675 [Dongiaceae bacterium]
MKCPADHCHARPAGRIHRDYAIDLDRPRRHGSAQFQTFKARILGDLDLELEG